MVMIDSSITLHIWAVRRLELFISTMVHRLGIGGED